MRTCCTASATVPTVSASGDQPPQAGHSRVLPPTTVTQRCHLADSVRFTRYGYSNVQMLSINECSLRAFSCFFVKVKRVTLHHALLLQLNRRINVIYTCSTYCIYAKMKSLSNVISISFALAMPVVELFDIYNSVHVCISATTRNTITQPFWENRA